MSKDLPSDNNVRDENENGDPTLAHTMKILVATDNHLGFMEKDPIRGNDTFATFEEILKKAKELEVDFLLLGGDLFHENKPSRNTLYKTMKLLREYCMGDKPVRFEVLSDQAQNFSSSFGCVNYEDPNYNVAIPLFSIHGNHDDPQGDGGLAALDLLSVANLVNYFGKSDSIDQVNVNPILLRKGDTKIALYGLGNIRDERLYRTFQQKKVKFMKPVESQEWFNILVLHQNRAPRIATGHIHEDMLDDFMDIVVWGHEHECLIVPHERPAGFYITQPGSSVATALSDGEAKQKHIGLLEVYKNNFRLKPLSLETVRPFVIDEVVLSEEEELDGNDVESVIDFLAHKVEEMISKAQSEHHNNRTPDKPLIRLKVDYTGFSTINPQRFGQRFVGKVANPNDILLFHKRRKTVAKQSKEMEEDMLARALRPEPLDNLRIEDLIDSFLSDSAQALELLPEPEFHQALRNFVDKDDATAIAQFISKTLQTTQKFLVKEDPTTTVDPELIQAMVSERTAQKRIEDQSNETGSKKEEEPMPAKGSKSDAKTKRAKNSLQLDEDPPNPPKKQKTQNPPTLTQLTKVKAEPNSSQDGKASKNTKSTKRKIESLSDILDAKQDNSDDENVDFNVPKKSAEGNVTKPWGQRKKNS